MSRETSDIIVTTGFSFSSFITNAATIIHNNFTVNISGFQYYSQEFKVNKSKSASYPSVLIHRFNFWSGFGFLFAEYHPDSNDSEPSSRKYKVQSTGNYLNSGYSIPSIATIESGIYSILGTTSDSIDSGIKDTNRLLEVTTAILKWIDTNVYILTSVISGKAVCYGSTGISPESPASPYYTGEQLDLIKVSNVKAILDFISNYSIVSGRYKAITYSVAWE